MSNPNQPTPGGEDVVRKYEELLEHDTDTLTKHEHKNIIDRMILGIGAVISTLALVLIATIILQVVMRYGFRHGLVVLEELQWHLYALGVMMGLSYAMVTDSHVRVDLVHMNLSERKQRWIEILGILFLLLPFVWVVFYNSLDFLADSWRVNERSDAPLGLPARWAIKSVIPISFGLLILAALSRLVHDVTFLVKGREK